MRSTGRGVRVQFLDYCCSAVTGSSLTIRSTLCELLGRDVRIFFQQERDEDLPTRLRPTSSALVYAADGINGAFDLVGDFSFDFPAAMCRDDDRDGDGGRSILEEIDAQGN